MNITRFSPLCATIASLALAASSAQALTIMGSAAPAATTVNGTTLITVTLNASEPVDELIGLTFNANWAGVSGISSVLGSGHVFGATAVDFVGLFDASSTTTDTPANANEKAFGVSAVFPAVAYPLPAGNSFITFQVKGLEAGEHTIHYTLSLTVSDPVEIFLDVPAADFSSTVTVSAVPEAHPAMMLAAGLAVMGLLARRRRA